MQFGLQSNNSQPLRFMCPLQMKFKRYGFFNQNMLVTYLAFQNHTIQIQKAVFVWKPQISQGYWLQSDRQ